MTTNGKNAQPQSAAAPGGADIAAAIHLVRNVVLQSALDCDCRDKVHEALRELEDFERQRNVVKLLAAAREERRKIGLLADMLSDFAEDDTVDEGVVETASLMFLDIAAAAQEGSRILREARPLKTCK
jgi:GTP cyclohydrolase II